MAEEQRIIPGITPKEEAEVIVELDGILKCRDKIAAYKETLAEHTEAARDLLKEHGKQSVVHGGHVFKRETVHSLSVNKLKKEGKAKKEKGDEAPAEKAEKGEKFTPKKAENAAAAS